MDGRGGSTHGKYETNLQSLHNLAWKTWKEEISFALYGVDLYGRLILKGKGKAVLLQA
jgi:hypothetical protein